MTEEKRTIQQELKAEQDKYLKEADKLYGIETTIKSDNHSSQVTRDATCAISLSTRLFPDNDRRIIRINALLRSLGTLRGVIHAIEFFGKKNKTTLESTLKRLDQDFTELVENIKEREGKVESPEKFKKELDELQAVFNHRLLDVMNQSKLLVGTESYREKKKLLLLYRYLSSSLDPAPTLTTTMKLPNDKTFTIKSTPITNKTDEQKRKLTDAIPEKETKSDAENFYTALPTASQRAIRAFRNEITDDRRTLHAQLRQWIPFGVKNAFVNESFVGDEKQQLSDDSKGELQVVKNLSVQSATLAFVGKGETNIQDPTTLNLKQLMAGIPKIIGQEEKGGSSIKLNLLILNTYLFDHEKQQRIIRTTGTAVSETRMDLSSVPVNWLGSNFESVRIPSYLEVQIGKDNIPVDRRFNKIGRAKLAAAIATYSFRCGENNIIKGIPVTLCASGQDRTNTVRLLTEARWLKKQFSELEDQALFDCLIASGHFSTIATILCPGSYGLKKASNPHAYLRDLFGGATPHLYCKLASTNKSVPMLGDPHKKNMKNVGIVCVIILLIMLITASILTSGGIFGALWLGWLALTGFSVGIGAVGLAWVVTAVGVSTYFLCKNSWDSSEERFTPLQKSFFKSLSENRKDLRDFCSSDNAVYTYVLNGTGKSPLEQSSKLLDGEKSKIEDEVVKGSDLSQGC